MASTINYPEKARDNDESGTTRTDSTAYHSDTERAERKGEAGLGEAGLGEPDSDHEEVEALDRGHVADLERQRVRISRLF